MDSSPSALFDGIRLRSPSIEDDPVVPGSGPSSRRSRPLPRASRLAAPISPHHLESDPGPHDHAVPAASTPAHESALKRAMAVALLFIAVELIGGLLTGSAALRADALHLLSDQVIVAAALFSSWLSRRPGASPKIEAVVGLLAAGLIGFTGVHMGVEAWERFVTPGAAATWSVALFALASLGANLSSALILRRHHGASLGAKSAFLVAMTDTVGSVGVIVSAAASILFGWAWAEPVAVALIGLMVVKIAWGLGKPAWKALRAPRA